MKNANLPILLIVVVVVALTAQFTRQSGEKSEWRLLRQDMVGSLTQLWEQPGHQVELVPAGDGADAKVTVAMPSGLRTRKQRWNHPFLRFVAQRHPGVRLKNLSVVEGGTDRMVPETAMAGLLADRVRPDYKMVDPEEGLCQLTSRRLSSALQRKLGPGRELVLVDAQLARSQRNQLKYGRRAYVQEPPIVSNRVMVTEICVVVDHEVSPGDWEKFRAENSVEGAKFRVVTLPKP